MPKIAIIEDDISLADMYKIKLESAGYECIVAYDGQAGLDMIYTTKFDLVLLDLMLPQMTGSEVLANYRKTENGKDTKVIILTNISEYEAPDGLYELGILRYMVKANYTPSQVVVVVQEALAA
ncbi:response regulator [Candidatus Saccharibacteria bacterium]|nr:response regulator [Candidatus Saccharibacteria bacterium]